MLCYSSPTQHDVEMVNSKQHFRSPSSSDRKSIFSQDGESSTVMMPSVDASSAPGTTVYLPGSQKPRSYLGLAVVTLVCFNIPFGVAAVLVAVRAHRDFMRGQMSSARIKGKISMTLSIFGIVSTTVAIFLVIFWPAIASVK